MPGKRLPVPTQTAIERGRKGQPLIQRTSKARAVFVRSKKTKANKCYSIEMTIPAEVARLVGVRIGDTMLVSGHADGFWVSKGGDLMSAEDRDL